ncbi:helix-turn-helix transcriptional regulator [Clostridium sp. DL1XJH146]
MESNIDIISILKNISQVITTLLGSETEVLIHDLKSGEIIFISNGHLSGRTIGDIEDKSTLSMLSRHTNELNSLIGYSSTSKDGRPLKSSTIFIKDNYGNPIYALCINQDISTLQGLQNLLGLLTKTVPLESIGDNQKNQTIQQITTKIIIEEISKSKPFSLDSKQNKLSIIKRLDDKGVFDVKDAIPKVCELLSISQATLYNYQRELKNMF